MCKRTINIEHTATITKKELLCPDTYILQCHCPEIAKKAKPGHFVEIQIKGGRQILRRPISIAGVDNEEIILFIKIRGELTLELWERNYQSISIIGPLGNYFEPPKEGTLHLIGGGIGLAPVYFAANSFKQVQSHLYYGIKSRDERILYSDLDQIQNKTVCIDNENGRLLDHMKQLQFHEKDTFFVCGPPIMMVKAAEMLYNYTNVFFSFESIMGCGLGICLGCVIPTRDGYKRVCYDGPVFPANLIDWRQYQDQLH